MGTNIDKKHTAPTIGAFYPCYKRPKAVIQALSSFREHYPDSVVYMVCDGGYDYSQLAEHFHCVYSHETQLGDGKTTILSDTTKVVAYLQRLYSAAVAIKEDYILLLEDDVSVMKPVDDALPYSINGTYWKAILWPKEIAFLKKRGGTHVPCWAPLYFFGAWGGCILNRAFVLKHFTDIERDVALIESNIGSKVMYSDILMSLITLLHGGTIGNYAGYCQTQYWNYEKRKKNGSISVLHQYKEFYEAPLTDADRGLLGVNFRISEDAAKSLQDS